MTKSKTVCTNPGPDGERYFYHSDHLGSSAFITSENGYATQFLAYMPYGETLAEEQNNTNYYSPFKFSAKEKDPETGYSYFGARYFSPELSVWLSVDPMADKYPSLSSYNYCAWNPVMFVDPNGMELDVAENASSKKDLLSIVSSANRDRVVIDGKKVSLNFEGLSSREKNKMLRQDKGMALINDMVNSDKKMLFESTEISLMNDAKCEKVGIANSLDDNGVINASNFGRDSEGGHTVRPADGYDGHVTISSSDGYEIGGVDTRRSTIFHELAENYYRTHFGYDFKGNSSNQGFGAHSRASSREGTYFGNPIPGYSIFNSSGLTLGQRAVFPIIIEHYKGRK